MTALLEPAANRCLFGMVAGGQSASSREATIGRVMDVHHTYWGWTTNWLFPLTWMDPLVAGGRTIMISWDTPGGVTTGSTFLTDITSGTYDSMLATRATAIAGKAYSIFLRPMYEMNGSWQKDLNAVPTGLPASDYVAAWRYIVNKFRANGATNVAFVWCPNRSDSPVQAGNHWADYYPGASFVDWVGVDSYNWGSNSSGDGTWWTPDQCVRWGNTKGSGASIYSDYSATHPIMLGEYGCVRDFYDVGGNTKKAWFQRAPADIKAFSRVKAVVYFDKGQPSFTQDWRPDSEAIAAGATYATDPTGTSQAFTNFALTPYFNGGDANPAVSVVPTGEVARSQVARASVGRRTRPAVTTYARSGAAVVGRARIAKQPAAAPAALTGTVTFPLTLTVGTVGRASAAAGAVTTAIRRTVYTSAGKIVIADVTFSNSYGAGGDTYTFANFGIANSIDAIVDAGTTASSSTGFVLAPDLPNKKLRLLGGAASGAALRESSVSNQAATVARVAVYGDDPYV